MPPATLQLQSLGTQDVYLTKDPQINIFKYNYYRYVNFATESVKIPLNEIATFNKKTSCNIPKRGHLLSRMYLCLKLPKLTKTSGTYLSWSDTLGYSIFPENDPIELEIGGVVIDKLYPRCLDMNDELKNNNNSRNLMLLKGDTFVSSYNNALKETDLIIPLDFWFCKNYASALPIVSMTSQEIRVLFKFKEFENVVNYDGSSPDQVNILDSNLIVEYIYLDDSIVDTFSKQKHSYIIEQIQTHGEKLIPANTSIFNTTLSFNHPVKELVFACVEKQNIDSNNYFVYNKSLDDTNIITDICLVLDGKRRFEFLPEYFYRLITADSVHSNTSLKYIYSIPFSIRTEDNQPTGSINMSRFTDVILSLKIGESGITQECFVYIYAISYNVATIENGFFKLEFSS